MSETQRPLLQDEWITLQNQFDSYEKYSLGIKLLNILLCAMLVFALNADVWTLFFVAILWLQDGIWKTFQGRIGQRLKIIEKGLEEKTSIIGMQFNTTWSQTRPGHLGLVTEYIKQSVKPTVAYPHVGLLILVLIQCYID